MKKDNKLLTVDSYFKPELGAPNADWWSDWQADVDAIHSMGYQHLFKNAPSENPTKANRIWQFPKMFHLRICLRAFPCGSIDKLGTIKIKEFLLNIHKGIKDPEYACEAGEADLATIDDMLASGVNKNGGICFASSDYYSRRGNYKTDEEDREFFSKV